MSLATNLQSLVTRLTKNTSLGNTAVFTIPVSKTYDPATGKITQSAPLTQSIGIGGPIGVDPRLIDGDLIQERDQIIFVEDKALTFVPQPSVQTVTINSKDYAIVEVTPFRVQDTQIAYKLRIR